MITFKNFLIESAGANKHLEHIEDEILNNGFDGLRKSIIYLSSIAKILRGNSKKSVRITTKWDGAPAIIAGTDPETGKFFVATKHGATAKNMKLNFTVDDVDKNHPAEGLNKKMKQALEYLNKIGMKDIYQGDLLYSDPSEKKIQVIDGQKMITFTPNTITYAVPINTSLGKKIINSKVGIVFHTKYDGNGPVNQMNASFDIDLSTLKQSKDVWFRDANYENLDGLGNFTEEENSKIFSILTAAGKLFRSLDKEVLNKIASSSDLNIQIKAFTNSKVREGKLIGNTSTHMVGLINYLRTKLEKEVQKLKTEKGREKKRKNNEEFLSFFTDNKNELIKIFDMQNLLIAAKIIIIKKLQEISQETKTFIKTGDGYKVTNPEGFVAFTSDDGAVKLVDRLEFSMQNFTNIKTW